MSSKDIIELYELKKYQAGQRYIDQNSASAGSRGFFTGNRFFSPSQCYYRLKLY